MKYMLVYSYHDTYVERFATLIELTERIIALKYHYRYESDFKYQEFEVQEITLQRGD